MIKLRPREVISPAQRHTANDDDDDDDDDGNGNKIIFSSKQMTYAQIQLGLIPSVPG